MSRNVLPRRFGSHSTLREHVRELWCRPSGNLKTVGVHSHGARLMPGFGANCRSSPSLRLGRSHSLATCDQPANHSLGWSRPVTLLPPARRGQARCLHADPRDRPRWQWQRLAGRTCGWGSITVRLQLLSAPLLHDVSNRRAAREGELLAWAVTSQHRAPADAGPPTSGRVTWCWRRRRRCARRVLRQ